MSKVFKKTPPRRKWRFEKGRNSSSVIVAVLTTAAVLAVITGLFRYEYIQEHKREENSASVRIDPELNYALFEVLDRHDPARTFGMTGGNSVEVFAEKKYGIELNAVNVPEIKDYPVSGKKIQMPLAKLPLSIRYAGVLPSAVKRTVPELRNRIFTQDGQEITLPALAKLDGKAVKNFSMVKISGDEFLKRAETVISSGNKKLDRQLETLLKNSGVVSGTYLINWSSRAGEK